MSAVKLGLVLAIILALAGVGAWIYNQGGEAVEIKTERQNNAAGTKSEDARSAYDLCVPPIGSGVYDFATRKCKRASARGRH